MMGDFFIHDIDPVLFRIGPLKIAWYGISYAISFLIGLLLVKKNLAKKGIQLPAEHYGDFLFAIIFGVMIGGRLGYVFFYRLTDYMQNPWHIFAVWEGGMSFHGGMLGVIIAALIFCKKYKYNFYTLADPTMPLVAIGVGIVRMANFINGELYGSITNVPWAVIFFRTDPLRLPRHPSQIYESFLEGFLMAILLQFLLFKIKLKGIIFWLFIGIYGIVRFLIEFIRLPDDISLYANGMLFGCFSMGQVLSLLMIAVAVFSIILINYREMTVTK